MLGKLSDWAHHRSGFRTILSALLIENIPGGAKWRYVWGSCLAFVFSIQLITGLLLMTAYSPGASTAWSSAYYIQYEMDFGWLIRGLHHFGSQTMVVLLGIHMLQVVIAGAHLPPREVNWWLGLCLLASVLGLSLTGYLLPWDQKGFWATQVATNIAGNLPGIGSWLQKIVVGGPVYGHHTLTRFYTLHVGILPALVILLTIAHLAVFRRHGVTAPLSAKRLAEGDPEEHLPGDGWFWPDQAFRDLVVCLVIFGVMLGLVMYGSGHELEDWDDSGPPSITTYGYWAHAGQYGKGANLDAPADPARPYPARPEWYFLFLFQLLKYFEGEQEIIGTVIIPNGVLILLALLPLLGFGRMRKFGHVFGVFVVVLILTGAATLTGLALQADHADTQSAKLLRQEQEEAERLATRAVNLAHAGVPADGATLLLRRDPQTRGPALFRENCATCHSYGSFIPNEKAAASNLDGFATEPWIDRLLLNPGHADFFGRTKLTTMRGFIEETFPNFFIPAADQDKLPAEENQALEKDKADLKEIAHWLSKHPRNSSDRHDTNAFKEGQKLFKERTCSGCHAYEGQGGTRSNKGPDLTGYGDAAWLREMIMAPASPKRYGETNAMPSFRDLEGADAATVRLENAQIRDLLAKIPTKGDADARRKEIDSAHRLAQLSDVDREIIIRWLTGDQRVVFGGDPVAP
ncbi:MAG TPA: cytochrome b N-terminal domain-containing protein [Gemmataceae bacterium]|nr:cytochrome b N-terminal domain-containing protein [Gemmataceae bacterium]